MHLLVAGEARRRSGTFHSRHIGVQAKGSFVFNGIDKQSRAGRWDEGST
jgi:hypothetical protein